MTVEKDTASHRVCVVVSAPAGADPEGTARAIAFAVQRVAPGADVYTMVTDAVGVQGGVDFVGRQQP